MNNKNIELSPKYGVNPTSRICCWCGKSKGIAMLGHIRKKDKNGRVIHNSDLEAPREMVLDYDMCDNCLDKLKKANAVGVIEISEIPRHTGMQPIRNGEKGQPLYPTFNMVGISPEWVDQLMPNCGLKPGDVFTMEEAIFQKFFSDAIHKIQSETSV